MAFFETPTLSFIGQMSPIFNQSEKGRINRERAKQPFEKAVMQARRYFLYVGGIIGYFRLNVNDEFPFRMGSIPDVAS